MQTFRVYFNNRAAAPLVWSVDDGDQVNEQAVREACATRGCRTRTVHNGNAANNETPVAWLEIEAGGFVVVDEIAYFYGELTWKEMGVDDATD